MHFNLNLTTTLLLTLTAIAPGAIADCSASWAKPDEGDIALYRDENCKGSYVNVGALNSCQNWPDFDACSAVTRGGVVCDIFKTDGCRDDYVVSVDSAGYSAFCGAFRDNIQSVKCRAA